LNGPWTFVKNGSALATAIALFFVVFGDFRYFVVFEESMQNAWKIPRAAVWSLVVPAAAQIVRWRFPRIESDDRSTFLVYELLFFLLAASIRIWRVPRAKLEKSARRATQFEILMYSMWIAADVGLMTTGRDIFYGVRLLANLMYYVALVPFMTRRLEEART
jgi:hypothetical protein